MLLLFISSVPLKINELRASIEIPFCNIFIMGAYNENFIFKNWEIYLTTSTIQLSMLLMKDGEKD